MVIPVLDADTGSIPFAVLRSRFERVSASASRTAKFEDYAGHNDLPDVFGSVFIVTDRIRSGMQFDATKTVLALVFVYGTHVGVNLAGPAAPYAVTIGAVPFLAFGTPIRHFGFRYGELRAKRPESGRDPGRVGPRPEGGGSR